MAHADEPTGHEWTGQEPTEHELIRLLTDRLAGPENPPGPGGAGDRVAVGPGDDAAVLELGGQRPHSVVVTVDAMVDGRHFDRTLSSLSDVGWKLVAVNVSDLAAMGARPVAAVVALCRPDDLRVDEVLECHDGMRESADAHGIRLVGGDVVGSSQLVLSLTAVGTVTAGAAVRRDGARPGDLVVVAGTIGAAAAGLALHRAGREVPTALAEAHRRPRALPGVGQALARSGARAMIDVSDGLGADLGHICRRSGVAARLDLDALPLAGGVAAAAAEVGTSAWELAVGGGDDYALVAALPPGRLAAAEAAVAAASGAGAAAVGLRVVGEITQPGPDGRTEPLLVGAAVRAWVGDLGFDHGRT